MFHVYFFFTDNMTKYTFPNHTLNYRGAYLNNVLHYKGVVTVLCSVLPTCIMFCITYLYYVLYNVSIICFVFCTYIEFSTLYYEPILCSVLPTVPVLCSV